MAREGSGGDREEMLPPGDLAAKNYNPGRAPCTHDGGHPYAEHWRPDAHTLGYEHGFINPAYDILQVLGGHEPTVPIPDFHDAYQTQRLPEAALVSAAEHRPLALSEVK